PLEKDSGGDVADLLEKGTTIQDIIRIAKDAAWWKPKPVEGVAGSRLFVPASAFMKMVPEQVDWAVESIIERGANGFFAANPKGGKSWAVIDLCLAMATGTSWLGFKIPKRMRVGLVSREDNPSLTGYRMRALRNGRGIYNDELDGWLCVNSR